MPSKYSALMAPVQHGADRHFHLVISGQRLLQHGFFAVAFDMQNQIAGNPLGWEGEGQPLFARTFSLHGHHATRAIRAIARARWLPPGKNEAECPSPPMPSTATSKGYTDLRSFPSQWPLPANRGHIVEQWHELRRLCPVLQQMRLDQQVVGAGIILVHEAFIHQRYRNLAPVDVLAESARRSVSAWNRRKRP